MSKSNKFPKRGEIWLLKNPERIKEFSKDYRPVLIISSDEQNEFDVKVAAVPLTTEEIEHVKIFEVFIENTSETGLDYPSKILLNYPFTLEKELRLEKERLGVISRETMEKVKKAWKIAFDSENW